MMIMMIILMIIIIIVIMKIRMTIIMIVAKTQGIVPTRKEKINHHKSQDQWQDHQRHHDLIQQTTSGTEIPAHSKNILTGGKSY